MLDVQELRDEQGAEIHGKDENPERLSSDDRLQAAVSILATAVLRRKSKKSCGGSELQIFQDSSSLTREGLDSLREQSVHS
jgi:hypothetical protein